MSGDCGCGCGGSRAATMTELAGTGFVRPKFFGGMLLTEDDLQAAIDYMVAKRKLTNREVVGAGVVCGLDVKPDPCDARSVIVSPGYAIECCGNDILVSCPERVDIIELVRELRQRTGVDCGEPCDKQPRKDYYLYIRYAETPTAPVAPYAPDDCATGDCEFSRISEGYGFELRCEGSEDPSTLLDELRKCRPKDTMKRTTDDLIATVSLVDHREAILQSLREDAEPVVVPPPASEFRKVQIDPNKPEAGVRFDVAVELVNRVLAAEAQEASIPGAEQPGRKPLARAVVEQARRLAEELRASAELKAKPADEQERIMRLLNTVAEQPDLSQLGPIDRGWLRAGTMPGEAERTFVTKADAAQGEVLRELTNQGQAGSEEFRSVSAMRFERFNERSASDLVRLASIFLRMANACTCAAFNPPCATCTDDAVEIAKVKVDGCDVVDVCELDRRWVLSPRAVGYWMPVVDELRGLLERICCGYDKKRLPDEGADEQETSTPYALVIQTGKRLQENVVSVSGDEATLRAMADLQRQLDAVTRRLDKLAEGNEVPA